MGNPTETNSSAGNSTKTNKVWFRKEKTNQQRDKKTCWRRVLSKLSKQIQISLSSLFLGKRIKIFPPRSDNQFGCSRGYKRGLGSTLWSGIHRGPILYC